MTRPFKSLDEFYKMTGYNVGDAILIRSKTNQESIDHCLILDIRNDQDKFYIKLGNDSSFLDSEQLYNLYEYGVIKNVRTSTVNVASIVWNEFGVDDESDKEQSI